VSRQLPLRPQPGEPGDDPVAGLREVLLATRPDAGVELVRRAYDVAAYWHQGG